MSEIAYRTTNADVLAEWSAFKDNDEAVRAKRRMLEETVGRRIYVNRGTGFGSTRIVGFERFESDNDGDLVGRDGCLVVSNKRGQHNGLVVPNLRRKAGKEFATELEEYTTAGLVLLGMASFHVYTLNGQMYGGGPSVAVWDDPPTMYALCQSEDWPVNGFGWEGIPLSVYHAAKEKADA